MISVPFGVGYAVDTAEIEGLPASERWLSQLAGLYSDQDAFNETLQAGDCLVYKVTGVETSNGEGQLHYALGLLMPGRVGDEYFMTRGHIHAWRPAAEVYICLKGQGIMLLENEQTGESNAVALTPAHAVYVPGHTAHRTVNTGQEPLIYWGVLSCAAGHDYEYVSDHPFQHVVVQVEGQPVVMSREAYQNKLSRSVS